MISKIAFLTCLLKYAEFCNKLRNRILINKMLLITNFDKSVFIDFGIVTLTLHFRRTETCMEDSFLHKGLRQKLVTELKKKGISDELVLEAINKVPRHLFMESGFVQLAYKDKAFPIGANQTISQPYTVAVQSSLLQIKRGDKVLEIGTGSGYQAAVLEELGASVFTIERHKSLSMRAQILLPKLGYRPRFFYGDGFNGLPTYAPFDKIIVTAGAAEMPVKLIEQLKPGGLMVIPVGDSENQTMYLLQKNADGTVEQIEHGSFLFVPMLKGKQ